MCRFSMTTLLKLALSLSPVTRHKRASLMRKDGDAVSIELDMNERPSCRAGLTKMLMIVCYGVDQYD